MAEPDSRLVEPDFRLVEPSRDPVAEPDSRLVEPDSRLVEPSRDLGPEPDPESVARAILLDQLTGRARSRSDLAKKLAQRNVPEEVAARLLDRFEEVGLVDDEAFAREWVAQRQQGRGLARRALALELRRKGIEDEVAREALDEIDETDEVDAARRLVRRRLRSVRDLPVEKATRRLVGMLARKGHTSAVAYRVVREELDSVDLGVDPGVDLGVDLGVGLEPEE